MIIIENLPGELKSKTKWLSGVKDETLQREKANVANVLEPEIDPQLSDVSVVQGGYALITKS